MNEYNLWVLYGLLLAELNIIIYSRLKQENILTNTLEFFRVLVFIFILGNIGYNLFYNPNPSNWEILSQSAFFSLKGLFITELIVSYRKSKFNRQLFTLSLIIVQFVGKIGCYYANCCYGIIDIPFIADKLPLQLFEIYGLFIILVIVHSMFYLIKSSRNVIMYIYFILYFILRFIAEFYRSESVLQLFDIRITHILSIVIIAISIVRIIKIKKGKK